MVVVKLCTLQNPRVPLKVEKERCSGPLMPSSDQAALILVYLYLGLLCKILFEEMILWLKGNQLSNSQTREIIT